MSDLEYYVGIMSGTSLDGVDVAVIESSEDKQTTLHTRFFLFPEALQKRLSDITLAESWIPDQYYSAETELTRIYANAASTTIKECNLSPDRVTAIGCHGQTVRHRAYTSPPYTVQMINGALLAELTGCTVVTDFRRRDMAAGGQGAPLAPAFHVAALQSRYPQAGVLNLGGIANLTQWHGDTLLGFDTGPANGLMDAWMQSRYGKPRDENGHQARQGTVNTTLLESFLKHPFLALPAPKSTGREEFNLSWLQTQLESVDVEMTDDDVLATLAEFTAVSIARSINESVPYLFVCGGGVHNSFLLERISNQLPETQVVSTAEAGIDPDFMEAIAFAWLARQAIHLQPGNQPAVTGAQGFRILGAIYPR